MCELLDYIIKNNIDHEIKNGCIFVGSSLDLENTNVSELPEGLSVGGSLDLGNTNVSELPEGLSVGGSLDLENTNVSELPEGLSVGDFLDLENTNVSELPEGLSVGGSLYLGNTNVSELPEGLSVGGSLYLGNTNVSELPEGLSVGGSLYLRNTNVSELPEGLSVGGSLYLRNTNVSELPEGLSVGGGIAFDHGRQLKNTSSFKERYGKSKRTIFCFYLKENFYIQAGCFFGTFESFCSAVKEKCNEIEGGNYISDAQDCVNDLSAKLKIKSAATMEDEIRELILEDFDNHSEDEAFRDYLFREILGNPDFKDELISMINEEIMDGPAMTAIGKIAETATISYFAPQYTQTKTVLGF